MSTWVIIHLGLFLFVEQEYFRVPSILMYESNAHCPWLIKAGCLTSPLTPSQTWFPPEVPSDTLFLKHIIYGPKSSINSQTCHFQIDIAVFNINFNPKALALKSKDCLRLRKMSLLRRWKYAFEIRFFSKIVVMI